ncbi:MAG: hypothetical protein QXY39_04210 [Thermofilaceae archaeon]
MEGKGLDGLDHVHPGASERNERGWRYQHFRVGRRDSYRGCEVDRCFPGLPSARGRALPYTAHSAYTTKPSLPVSHAFTYPFTYAVAHAFPHSFAYPFVHDVA